jgi:hypothetical protein
MAILDDGITDALQNQIGKRTAFEYDYYFDVPDTDEGVPDTHGDKVFRSALSVSRAYDVLDLKVLSPAEDFFDGPVIERALDDIVAAEDINIAAVSISFSGGSDFSSEFADEISELASRGVLTVASVGNKGTPEFLEEPEYPAALTDVIRVGSHDGFGNPSPFSRNGPAVDILADGEDVPGPGLDGTSFAAPRVSATVTHVQAIVEGLTGEVLGVGGMLDALWLDGAAPRSNPDPADGVTRYFLHDHDGSLDYAWFNYGGSPGTALAYIASNADLIDAFGADAEAGRLHYEHHGSVEERAVDSFDAAGYLANYADLRAAYGGDEGAATVHFITAGYFEGRTDDLFITAGYLEGRTDDLEAGTGAADFFL